MSDVTLVLDCPVTGYRTTALTEWSISSDYETPTDGWSATISDPERRAEALRLLNQPVTLSLTAGGVESVQLVGRVDQVGVSSSDGLVALSGRDRLADLTTSHPHPASRVVDGQSLEQLILALCAPHGITEVGDDDGALSRTERVSVLVSGAVPATSTAALRSGAIAAVGAAGITLAAIPDPGARTAVYRQESRTVGRAGREVKDLKPEEAQSVFEFLNRVAARTGATIQPSTRRNRIELEAPDYEQPPIARLVSRQGDPRSNVISSSAARDVSALPSVADFSGFGGGGGKTAARLSSEVSIPTLLRAIGHDELVDLADTFDDVKKKPGELGDGLRCYRYYRQEDKEAKTREAVDRLALAAVTERLRSTLEYEATVPGLFSASGNLWTIGAVVDVDDAYCAVHEPMWIHSLERRWSASDGATTTMRCWRLGTYQVDTK